jgi:hypothetical protein
LPSVATGTGASRGSADAAWLASAEADDALALEPTAGAPAFADACVGALLVADGPASQAPSARANAAAPIKETTLIFILQSIAHSAREQRKNNFQRLSRGNLRDKS